MKLAVKAFIQSALLLVGSFVVALALGEGMARVYSKIGVTTREAPHANQVALREKYFNANLDAAQKLERPIGVRYVGHIETAPGVSRAWFTELPFAPDRNPRDVDAGDFALLTEYVKRGHYGPHSFYLWNERFAEGLLCDRQDEIFKNLPQDIKVFVPPDGTPFPRFRFPPNKTLPSGLKTNRYGFRGVDFAPDRSKDTLRIAFIGSSETVANHSYPFSYPEYFGVWLNRWLAENGYQLRAEIINAGEEGIGTTDVAAILEQSILPLNPDYVIFYDGANQLLGAQSLVSPPVSTAYSKPTAGPGKDKSFLYAHSQLWRIVESAYTIYLTPLLDDWKRPSYQFSFPATVNEANPDINSDSLPLGLPVFVRDLNTMAERTRASDIPFFIATPVWLDGSELSAIGNPDQLLIAAHLKSQFWPLRSRDIRRLIDFENRSLRKFARSSSVGLLEVANRFPRDPALFTDAYHLMPEGLKLLAWIALQDFLPRLEQDLRSASVPRMVRSTAEMPSLRVREISPICAPAPRALVNAKAISLPKMKQGSTEAALEHNGESVAFISRPAPWAYIGRETVDVSCLSGGGWLTAEIRLSQGTVGIGLLNRKGDDFITTTPIYSGPQVQTVHLRIDSFSSIGDFILRNWEGNESARGELLGLKVATSDGSPPALCAP